MGRNTIVRAIQGFIAAAVLTAVIGVPSSTTAHANDPIRLYVFAGQSNMVGTDTMASELALFAPAPTAPGRVLFWGPVADYPSAWGPLKAPTEILQPRYHSGFGPEIGAAHELARRHAGTTIAIVKLATGGTSLYRDWSAVRRGGHYDSLIARVRRAADQLRQTRQAPVRIAGFFWMQGESDARFEQSATTYAGNLSAFIRAVRRDLAAPRLPFVIGRITDLRRENPGRFLYSDHVRRAQQDVARSDPRTFLVTTDDLERANTRIHFSSRGTYDLGRRFVRPAFPL